MAVRKDVLRECIKTFNDLYNKLGNLPKYLAEEHDTLVANGDSTGQGGPTSLVEDLKERIKHKRNRGPELYTKNWYWMKG
jgi:hypothetical protein